MRILFTLPSLHPDYGGPARSVPALALALRCVAGIEVWLSAQDGSESDRPEVRDISVHFHVSIALQELESIDLIHDHGVWQRCHIAVARCATRRGIPRVVSPRGMLEPWALSQKKWKKRIAWFLYQRRLLTQCRLVHATSTAEESNLRKLGLTMPIAVIPNGMDLPSLAPPGVEGFAKPATPRNALFLSRLHPKKGLELLIEAWAKIRPSHWHLLVAGPGDPNYIQFLKDLVARHHLQAEIEFLGPISDHEKPSLFERAELFLLPSYSENFGMVVAEALSFGIPVITTTGCPWSELESFRCGWWVEPTAGSISDALSEATTLGSDTLAEMGRRGRSLISERYAWAGIARRMSDAYGQLLLPSRTL